VCEHVDKLIASSQVSNISFGLDSNYSTLDTHLSLA